MISAFAGLRRRAEWDAILPIALLILSFALYARTATPGVLDGDAGEFQTNIYRLGVSHTGYPLYFLLAKVWTLIVPVGSIAFRANLFSSLGGAITLVLLYALLLTITRSRVASFLTAALFGASRVQWSQAVIPDVYTLNSVLIILTLWVALLWREGRISLAWVAFAYGLSLTHHRTMILFAPALGVFVLPGILNALRQPVQLLKLVFAFALPLFLYLYVPLRGASDVGVEYQPNNNVSLFALNVVYDLRFGPPGFIWERITQAYLGLLIEQFTLVGFLFGLIGIVVLALNKYPRPDNLQSKPVNVSPRGLLWVIGAAHLCQAAFAIVFWVFDSEIFFIPADLTFLIFSGIGIGYSLHWLRSHVQAVRVRYASVSLLVFALVAASGYLLWNNFPRVDKSRDAEIAERWQTILAQPLEENAIFVGPWEDLTPLEYYQYVENVRTDLRRFKVVIYQDQLKLVAPTDPVSEIARKLSRGENVYLTRHPYQMETMGGLLDYQLVPIATLWRMENPSAENSPAAVVDLPQDTLVRRLSVQPKQIHAGDFVTVALTWSKKKRELPLDCTLALRDARGFLWADEEQDCFLARRLAAKSTESTGSVDLLGAFVPPDAPPGDYTLELSASNQLTGMAEPLLADSPTITQTLTVSAPNGIRTRVSSDIPHPLAVQLSDVQLVGYGLSQEEPRAGDKIELATWWHGLAGADDPIEIRLRDASGGDTVLYQGKLVLNASGVFNPHQTIRARHALSLAPTLPPGPAQILLTLDGTTLPPFPITVQPSGRLFTAPTIQHAQFARFGDSIHLLGYRIESASAKPGQPLEVVLYWLAPKPTSTSYKIFVHLLDNTGQLRAQQDSIPLGGTLPTDRWYPGEYITDSYRLPLPPDLTPGDYRIEIGMYDPNTLERLSVFDQSGLELQDRRVLLDQVLAIR